MRFFIYTLTVATPIALLEWWIMGALGGFHLWERIPGKVQRWIKIYGWLTLFAGAGGVGTIGAKGCGAAAAVQHLAGGPTVAPMKVHALGNVALPPVEFLTRLKAVTAKQEQKRQEEETRDLHRHVAEAIIKALTFQPNGPMHAIPRTRVGPFCHVTCAVHHGTLYDRETLPEFCRANWIPPDTLSVPGWWPLNNDLESITAWPGPASPGFESYKLYWTDK